MFRKLTTHAKWMSPSVALGLGLGLCCVSSAAAQSSAPTSKPPARPAATKATIPAPAHSADVPTREQILASAEWNDTLRKLEEWFDSQRLYDVDQIKQFRLRLAAGIKRMTPVQMQRFITEMGAKLEVLEGERAHEAQDYLTENLAVASTAYARKVRQQLPDVLSMNAVQIDQKLAAITAKRASTAQMQKSLEYARQRQVANNEAMTKARLQQQAADRASDINTSPQPNNFTPSSDYYPYSNDAFDTGYDGYAGVTWTIGTNRF